MDLFDSALIQSLHLQRKFGRLISGGPQSAIRQDVTTITLLKDTSTRGSSRVNKSPCNTKHSSLLYHFYDLCWFPLLLCLRCATKTDKREQNRFNEDKCANLVCTNVAFQVSSDAFFSPPLLKMLLLSITVIRLIPVRYLTAREGDASALAVLWSARFSWENEWTNRRRSAVALECTAVCTYFPLRGLLVKTLEISISWSKM